MKIIIIGNGPAGVSAALYTVRSGVETLLIGRDIGALARADKIENYYGFAEPVSGVDLVKSSLEGAKRLGVVHVNEEVLSLSFESDFEVTTTSGVYHSDKVLLATGASRSAPKIKGLSEREGSGVSYCAICDGFFFKGKNVCVLGNGEYAVHEAEVLSKIVGGVTILTNGEEAPIVPEGISVDMRKIAEIAGDGRVERIIFEADGVGAGGVGASGVGAGGVGASGVGASEIEASALFVAIGIAGSTAFAAKIGALTNGNKIVVNEKMETTVPNLYAAGDCTGGIFQIAKAVHEGMIAGMEMARGK